MRALAIFVMIVACRPGESRVSLASECMCPCACPQEAGIPDAAVDAPIDSPVNHEIDLASEWAVYILTPGAPTGVYRGADGVAQDAQECWWTPWEQGGAITRVCTVANPVTELVATGLVGAEDVKPGRFDSDPHIDGAVAVDATTGGAVYIAFREPGQNTSVITIGASVGKGHVQQIAVADVDGDGDQDIIFGTRVGSPAVVGWLENPGTDARIGILWNYNEISKAGWVMSLIPRDMDGDGDLDVIVSDRASYKDAAGVTKWDLYGSRWSEQTPMGWVSHAIGFPAGSCSPYNNSSCVKTPGDEMMLSTEDADGHVVVADCQSAGSQVDSRVMLHDVTASTHLFVPPVSNVGHCQHVIRYDVDLDGDQDIVVSTWIANALPLSPADDAKSSLYWLRNDGGGFYSRGEISKSGGKYDNLGRVGNQCIVTSEQLEPSGGAGVMVLCPPGVHP